MFVKKTVSFLLCFVVVIITITKSQIHLQKKVTAVLLCLLYTYVVVLIINIKEIRSFALFEARPYYIIRPKYITEFAYDHPH